MAHLRARAEALRLDGVAPPRITMAVLLSARAGLNLGKSVGEDLLVAEVV